MWGDEHICYKQLNLDSDSTDVNEVTFPSSLKYCALWMDKPASIFFVRFFARWLGKTIFCLNVRNLNTYFWNSNSCCQYQLKGLLNCPENHSEVSAEIQISFPHAWSELIQMMKFFQEVIFHVHVPILCFVLIFG